VVENDWFRETMSAGSHDEDRAANWFGDDVKGFTTLHEIEGCVLAGCALKAPPTHTDVVDQALPKATRIPPTWRADPRGGEVTNDWLRAFNDATLEALVAEAIANNPDYADAHFNLALLCERLGDQLKAVHHWKTYLKLDSSGQWAEIARRQLEHLRQAYFQPSLRAPKTPVTATFRKSFV
jgi:tetratricopeptide (TPR) repeat protein